MGLGDDEPGRNVYRCGENQRRDQSTSSDNYRLIGGDYGSFWRNDGNALYLMLTNAKTSTGRGTASARLPLTLNQGQSTFAHSMAINDSLTVNRYIRADKTYP